MEKLSDIVGRVQLKMGMSSEGEYARLAQFAIQGYKNLHMDVSGLPTIINLNINTSNFTAPMPTNFLALLRLCVCINGTLHPLQLDDNICLPDTTDDCGTLQTDTAVIDSNTGLLGMGLYAWQTPNYDSFGGIVNRAQWNGYFNLGGGRSVYGRYRIDTATNSIQLANVLAGELVMEYLALPEATNSGDFLVHPYDVLAIEYFTYWQSISMKSDVSGNQKQQAMNDWHREKRMANRRHQQAPLEAITQAMMKGYKLAAKA